ncbi:hypothetical protein C2E23DRAFT_736032 [Lenzites betulinus]|nr:hypothetical protein C2E23DRAFT_736032 [Lenzites betulinus]
MRYQFISTTPAGITSRPAKTCSEPGCRSGQKLANMCTRQRCKKHCLEHSTPCGFRAHDQERKTLASQPVPPPLDMFSLSHPEPATPSIPAILNTGVTANTQASSTTLADVARVHRVTMPDTLKADWDTAMSRQLQRSHAEAERRANMILVEHTFYIDAWVVEGEKLTQIQVQGPPSWPTIELAKLSHVIEDLNLHHERAVQRFNLATRSWVTLQLSYKIKVRSQEHILIWKIGVLSCSDLDDVAPYQRPCGTMPLTSTDSLMSLVTATSAMSLWPPVLLPMPTCAPPPALVSARTQLPTLVYAQPLATPSATPTLAFTQPTPLFRVYPAPAITDLPPARVTLKRPQLPQLALPDLDQLWGYNLVYAPRTTQAWPAGFYARDVAKAFALIGDDDDNHGDGADLELKASLAERFEFVFGKPFKSTTYQRSRRAWANSPQVQREWITNLPRAKNYTWTQARRQLDGWRKENGHKRGQGKHAGEDEVSE